MEDLNELNINKANTCLFISKWFNRCIKTTDSELISAIIEWPDSDGFISKLQEKYFLKRIEQYKKYKPECFEYAPKSAIRYRKTLENKHNIKQMEYLKSIVSYNSDGTINIIPIKKIFCKDFNWKGKKFDFFEAQESSKQIWYNLLTDYNHTDTEQEKLQSDWYKIINLFNNGKWDTPAWMSIFRNMTWCNYFYRTATTYENRKWNIIPNVACIRKLDWYNCKREHWYKNNAYRLCGIKDFI